MTLILPPITVFRIERLTNLFLFTEEVRPDEGGNYQVPGNCIQVPTPAPQAGKWPNWISDVPFTHYHFGEPGSGSWDMVDDHRKSTLYLTTDGSKYSIGSDQVIADETVSYPGYGPLPSWLTDIERPSQFHTWVTDAWVLDVQAKLEADKANERAWRDYEISRITWLRDRHRDELEQSLPTTLTEQQYQDLVDYIQDLRDWPADAYFPQQQHRPAAPAWLNP